MDGPQVPTTNARRVDRLIGVYHASGTLWGELRYWIGARTGGSHCALCDITHGSVREKPEWQACRAGIAVPFDTVHLNERRPDLEAFTEGHTPCVVAETHDGFVLVLDPHDLAECDGSPEQLVTAIRTKAEALGLTLDAE